MEHLPDEGVLDVGGDGHADFVAVHRGGQLGGRGGDDSLPYSADIQRTYFEGQQHLLKRDWNDAYGAFLKCVEAYPEEASFHFNLAKIDLELERFSRRVGLGPGAEA